MCPLAWIFLRCGDLRVVSRIWTVYPVVGSATESGAGGYQGPPWFNRARHSPGVASRSTCTSGISPAKGYLHRSTGSARRPTCCAGHDRSPSCRAPRSRARQQGMQRLSAGPATELRAIRLTGRLHLLQMTRTGQDDAAKHAAFGAPRGNPYAANRSLLAERRPSRLDGCLRLRLGDPERLGREARAVASESHQSPQDRRARYAVGLGLSTNP